MQLLIDLSGIYTSSQLPHGGIYSRSMLPLGDPLIISYLLQLCVYTSYWLSSRIYVSSQQHLEDIRIPVHSCHLSIYQFSAVPRGYIQAPSCPLTIYQISAAPRVYIPVLGSPLRDLYKLLATPQG